MKYDLTPIYHNQKSFYGKAKYEYFKENDQITLFSYDTCVCNALFKTAYFPEFNEEHHSRTTDRHIWEFCHFLEDQHGYFGLTPALRKIMANEKLSWHKLLFKLQWVDLNRNVYKLRNDEFSKGI